MAILITGGARSGKSGFAEQYAQRIASSGVYIATCQPYDDEMRERVRRHRQDREIAGFRWVTREEPLRVAELLEELRRQGDSLAAGGGKAPVVLLDCLTLWLTNVLLQEEAAESRQCDGEADRLVEAIVRYPYPLLIVTNEVGDGIVPEYPLGRQFRDEAGRLNQRIAAVCERVFLVTAGIPIDLRAAAFRWEDM
ncbi:bifunctional adenosylcobinamide kinase/adenosylcobinamide-phosphate guanylyltransferase [Paenibacillus sp. J5C_2022]|uniref:bifunctional adenosylcobinamide kinase/adenosylcobinamide-phosphate guanylyltransferase n=1 Tax=Paenibacillus sp. J5C2022 TaxID=2977129 RepID=UPI0021D1CF3E|nr:bifunctional adenosylcobinamide kinase/adenosylcobinamide-phosphate guanylyltransferase [Paenibacillus sp. J5C2022]MCU6707218.1 bifunctional adenosylcobinamide kinase/adenosylcobinamide-phosphate guanylyltransferase [Paenibacillus sp. J5C2022]